MNHICCYGEILWDIFEDKTKIGGAPLNSALRLKSFENKVDIISAVGNDLLGDKLISFIKKNGLSTNLILRNSYETGKVFINLDQDNNAIYDIKKFVAWDFINLNDQMIRKIKKSNAFIFGSLSARNHESKKTLFKLIEKASFKVLDVNLRPPYYNYKTIKKLLVKADFIKFNEEEIIEVSGELGHANKDIMSCVSFISKFSKTNSICVTKADKGAILFHENKFHQHNGFKVKVIDTVGSGDSFLAMLINELLNKNDPNKSLKKACAIGAMVATKSGANPEFNKTQIQEFIESY